MEGIFHAPRRKRTVYESYESPFPIPLSHDSDHREFKIYQAEIVDNCVIVTNPEDIQHLYSQGYFGKGILSRSRPQYNVAEQELLTHWIGSKPQFPIISSKKYQRHLEWAKELLQEQGLDLDSITKILNDYTSPLNLSEENSPLLSETELESDIGEEKQILEGNPMYDPLAKYVSIEPDTHETIAEQDKESLEKVHCHKHDDLITHCGCKPENRSRINQAISRPLEDLKHEYVLVQEEEEISEAFEDCKKEEVKKQLVCRRHPFRIFEYLQLSREEAFFLCYALGCLTVRYNKEPLTILKLWEVFSVAQPNFPTAYMAYHHFRSKGWVPKIGLKYGTDLLLYRKGPPFYHASYSVIVEFVDENLEGPPLRPLTWKSLAGLNRTTVNVSKELLFCYLIKSHGFSEIDLFSPECMKKIKVQELILNRWIASRERMDQDEL